MKNKVVQGKIVWIGKTVIKIELENNTIGNLYVSEISDYYVWDIEKYFALGEILDFIILKSSDDKILLGWKQINPRFQKNPFTFTIEETENGFTNLKSYINKEIKEW